MSNELIKKVYERFNGVWPEGVLAVYNNGEVGDLVMHYDDPSIPETHEAWEIRCTKADFDAYGESLKEEWTPEVGQECEASWGLTPDFWGNITYMGDHFFFEFKAGNFRKMICKDLRNLKFRPLKTESEKQADAMFDIVKDATDLYHACELLRDAGYDK